MTEENTPARKRATIWAIVALLAAALVAGVVYATNRDVEGDAKTSSADAPTKEGSVATTAGAPASSSAATPRPGTSAAPGKTTAPSASAAPVPPTASAPVPVEKPATEGSRLTTVTQPPAATLAMIQPSKLPADARYTIVFSPYGYGPQRNGQPSLAVYLDTCVPANDSAKRLDLEGRNLLAAVLAGENPVRVGGAYSGVLTFRPQGDLLMPVISEVKSDR